VLLHSLATTALDHLRYSLHFSSQHRPCPHQLTHVHHRRSTTGKQHENSGAMALQHPQLKRRASSAYRCPSRHISHQHRAYVLLTPRCSTITHDFMVRVPRQRHRRSLTWHTHDTTACSGRRDGSHDSDTGIDATTVSEHVSPHPHTCTMLHRGAASTPATAHDADTHRCLQRDARAADDRGDVTVQQRYRYLPNAQTTTVGA
jgi:hypothetical protein